MGCVFRFSGGLGGIFMVKIHFGFEGVLEGAQREQWLAAGLVDGVPPRSQLG